MKWKRNNREGKKCNFIENSGVGGRRKVSLLSLLYFHPLHKAPRVYFAERVTVSHQEEKTKNNNQNCLKYFSPFLEKSII